MKVWKITLTLKDDFHTRGEIKGASIDVLRDAEGNIFIPASNIKGVIRTEAERILPNKPECYITGKGEKKAHPFVIIRIQVASYARYLDSLSRKS